MYISNDIKVFPTSQSKRSHLQATLVIPCKDNITISICFDNDVGTLDYLSRTDVLVFDKDGKDLDHEYNISAVELAGLIQKYSGDNTWED